MVLKSKKKMENQQGKYWTFTDFELKTDYSFLGASYVIYGVELCPESNKTHHQGYCEFESNKRFNALKKLAGKFHWEKRRGTAEQAADYCKKDGEYFEFGSMKESKQGKRSDIDEVRALIKDGKGMKDIVEVATSYQSIRIAECYLKHNEKKRDWIPEVHWFWGPTGAGKTKRAVELAGDDYWISGRNLKWWEGYDAHENIIIDDFRKDFCTFHELLRILDRYPYRLEVKGSSRQLLAKKIFITSCYPPDKVYDTREDIAQLLRRVTFIVGIGIGIEVGGNTNPDLYNEI